jgi:hypothetical protein
MQLTDWIGSIAGVAGAIVAVGAMLVAGRANTRSSEANRIAQTALEMESRVDERQREFRAVEWDAGVTDGESELFSSFELNNVGDSVAKSVTVVLHLNPDRETHELGDIPAKGAKKITSQGLTRWMREAREHDVVHPGFRVHWSSPLGEVSDVSMPIRTFDDFIVRVDEDY